MPIRRLDPLLVNQIAAGEVIERPASVVKELVENSLDAGARRIAIDIEDGGKQLIRVADDGCGMGEADLPLALAPHATSKIAAAADLEAIATMGFRGEALASIASVAQVRLTSRSADDDAGHILEAAGERIEAPRPTGCAPGTVIEVRNVFFNTPARRKFLRGTQTEFSHIHEQVQRIALAHPAVGFALRHNDRLVADYPPDQPPRRRAVAILGDELDEALLESESDERGVKLWTLVGLPALARSTTRYQFVYVNGRPVRDRHIGHAIKEAYRGLIEPTRQPTVVLFIQLDPRQVDVNVHPAKAEVRFADSNLVHGQVLATIRQRLLGADLTPHAELASSGAIGSLSDPRPAMGGASADQPWAGGTGGPAGGNVDQFVDHFRRLDPRQKGFVYQQVREALGVGGEEGEGDDDGSLKGPGDRQPLEEHALGEAPRPAARPILQVHNSYIVTQDDDGLVIIDQHALHERMMFQTLIERVNTAGQLESQRLLTPVVIDVDRRQVDVLDQLGGLLASIGVEIEPIGPTAVAVHAFASLLFDRGVEVEPFVRNLLERAVDDDFEPSTEQALHEVLDMLSCKAAVKAGDRMAEEELAELLKRRLEIERASNCPHGRPTTVRLSLRELEKHFKRG